ncbi:UNVERIFIED_CONTAM: hypothetical protein H355_002085 [Colinus virginianus]|nr:hypothetical protein H355_002085 [Colinus virginianus]
MSHGAVIQSPGVAPPYRPLLTRGDPGPPRRTPGPGGTTALSTLLRCFFPCERLCGGCTMPPAPPRPPGALPPAVPPARRHRVPTTTRLPPRTFHSYLPRSHRTYSCVHCRAHLARHEELISKEQAFESSQKYKEGKFIIEMSHMVKENGWD